MKMYMMKKAFIKKKMDKKGALICLTAYKIGQTKEMVLCIQTEYFFRALLLINFFKLLFTLNFSESFINFCE